jgi:hypothetical protein
MGSLATHPGTTQSKAATPATPPPFKPAKLGQRPRSLRGVLGRRAANLRHQGARSSLRICAVRSAGRGATPQQLGQLRFKGK